jgi:hypothetical protein
LKKFGLNRIELEREDQKLGNNLSPEKSSDLNDILTTTRRIAGNIVAKANRKYIEKFSDIYQGKKGTTAAGSAALPAEEEILAYRRNDISEEDAYELLDKG